MLGRMPIFVYLFMMESPLGHSFSIARHEIIKNVAAQLEKNASAVRVTLRLVSNRPIYDFILLEMRHH